MAQNFGGVIKPKEVAVVQDGTDSTTHHRGICIVHSRE